MTLGSVRGQGRQGHGVLKPYAEYLAAYTEKVSQLLKRFPLGEEIVGEQAQKDFLTLFGSILRLRNILQAFDDFSNDDVLSLRDLQDYQSLYIDLYQQRRSHEEATRKSSTTTSSSKPTGKTDRGEHRLHPRTRSQIP